MQFHIYRRLSSGRNQHVGSTKFLEDAKTLLKQWHSGYVINAEGKMVVEKNL